MTKPDKPRLALRVGFVGKRNLIAPDRVGRQLREVLGAVASDVAYCTRQLEHFYSHQPARLIFISSAAKGADLLACQAALDLGWEVQILMPYDRAAFRTSGFDRPEDAAVFDRILSRASIVREMDLPPRRENESDAHNDAYDHGATLTVDYCDILVAVWDGEPIWKRGGTFESMNKALDRDIPVVVVRSDRPADPHLWNYPRGEDFSLIRGALEGVLRMPGQDAVEEPPQHRFERFLKEGKLSRWNPGIFFGWAQTIISLGKKPPPYHGVPRWQEAPEFERSSEIAEIRTVEQQADRLASHYASFTRGLYTINAFLCWYALSTAVARRFWPEQNVTATVHYILESAHLSGLCAALIAIYLWYTKVRRLEPHPRWIEYRMLSELSYACSGLVNVGASPRLRSQLQQDHKDFSGWVKWYVDALVRNLGVRALNLGARAREAFLRALTARVEDQRNYHAARKTRNEAVAKQIRNVNFILLLVLMFICGSEVLIFWAEHALYIKDFVGESNLHRLEDVASFGLLLAILGAALTGFSAQAEFAKVAQISNIMHGRMEALHKKLVAPGRTMNSGEDLRARGSEAVDIFLKEHEDWYLFYSLRHPEAPN